MTTKKLEQRFSKSLDAIDRIVGNHKASVRAREMGSVSCVRRNVAEISGLPTAQNDELLRFSNNQLGYVFNLNPNSIGCVLLDNKNELSAGEEVRRTRRVLDVPVGPELLGRVIDPLGRPLDGKGAVESLHRLPIERSGPAIMDRAPVTIPLQTGIKVIDA